MPENDIRLGIDISPAIEVILDPGVIRLEANADFRFKHRFFFTADYGFTHYHTSRVDHDYTCNGNYLRIGFDNNFLKVSNDIFYGGIRYGFSIYNQRADNIQILAPYWDDYQNNLSAETLTQHWIEFVTGMKVETFKNIYIGWIFHLKIPFAGHYEEIMHPGMIPGLGKGTRKTKVAMNYHLYYRIPWKKNKNKAVKNNPEQSSKK